MNKHDNLLASGTQVTDPLHSDSLLLLLETWLSLIILRNHLDLLRDVVANSTPRDE